MKLIKVAAAVLNQTPLDWAGNKANILRSDRRSAGAERPDTLPAGDEHHRVRAAKTRFTLSGAATHGAGNAAGDSASTTRGMIVSLGLPLLYQNGLFNAACLAGDGKILGFVAKQYLAGDGIHYEPRWFKPWPHGVRTEITLDGITYPLGDIYFDCGGVRIGFEICEDAWVAKRPGASLALDGVDIILNPSASHFAFGKSDVRKRFVTEGSRAFGVTYLYSNLLGNEAGRVIYVGGARRVRRPTARRGSAIHVRPFLRQRERRRRHRKRHAWAMARTASFMPELKEQSSARSPSGADFSFSGKLRSNNPFSETSDAWEKRHACQRGRVHPRGHTGALRLHAQEPRGGLRCLAQWRRRFGRGELPGCAGD